MLKNLILLTGFSTFVVIVIVSLNIYHNHSLSSLPGTTQKHVTPISPNFDKKTLETLEKRSPISVDLDEKSKVTSEDSPSATTPTDENESGSGAAKLTPTQSLQP